MQPRPAGWRATTVERIIPILLAILIAGWSLRGVSTNNIVDTDAARHAMNGAFIRDMVAGGHWAKPIEFGRYYYAHLPALSMPYHPPLFPAIEAVFFGIFGTSVLTGRLLVALFTAMAILLFCKLVKRTSGSLPLAFAAILTFCSWRFSQMVSSDVMLEFPSLLFCIAALLVLGDLDRSLPLGRALCFAMFASAAVWTKQHAVFLGAVPFAYILLTRRWSILRSPGLWVASVLFGGAVLALMALSAPFSNTGTDQVVRSHLFRNTLLHHIEYYWIACTDALTKPGAYVMLAGLVAAAVVLIRRHRFESGLALHASWAGCAFGVLLLLGPFDFRYLFFVFPPVAVIVYDMIGRGVMRTGLKPSYVTSAAALFFLTVFVQMPPYYLSGPSQAALAVVSGAPKRVLYCGSTDGNFTFAVRTLDAALNTTVMSGDKFADHLKDSAAFAAFAERYGVSDVIIESTNRAQTCDAIRSDPPPSLAMRQVIPLDSSLPRWRGTLTHYQVNTGSTKPQDKLSIPIPKISGSVDLKL